MFACVRRVCSMCCKLYGIRNSKPHEHAAVIIVYHVIVLYLVLTPAGQDVPRCVFRTGAIIGDGRSPTIEEHSQTLRVIPCVCGERVLWQGQ